MAESPPPSTWDEMLAPPPMLVAFLEAINVPQHAAALNDLGYDDVKDFHKFTDADVERMRDGLEL